MSEHQSEAGDAEKTDAGTETDGDKDEKEVCSSQ